LRNIREYHRIIEYLLSRTFHAGKRSSNARFSHARYTTEQHPLLRTAAKGKKLDAVPGEIPEASRLLTKRRQGSFADPSSQERSEKNAEGVIPRGGGTSTLALALDANPGIEWRDGEILAVEILAKGESPDY